MFQVYALSSALTSRFFLNLRKTLLKNQTLQPFPRLESIAIPKITFSDADGHALVDRAFSTGQSKQDIQDTPVVDELTMVDNPEIDEPEGWLGSAFEVDMKRFNRIM